MEVIVQMVGVLNCELFIGILLVYSMINMALKTAVWLTLHPIGILCERILMLVMILNLIAQLHTYNHFAFQYHANF